MGWIEALVLGAVEGLTEFLPISSSAHQLLAGQLLFGGHDPGAAFTAVNQIGAETAVLIYFFRDIVRIVKAWFLSLIGKVPRSDPDARLGWFVIVGSIPIAVLGLLFQDAITTTLRNLWITVAMLFLVGIVLWLADVHAARVAKTVQAAKAAATPRVAAARQVTEAAEAAEPAAKPRRVRDDTTAEIAAAVQVAQAAAAPVAGKPVGKTLDRMTWRDAIIYGLCQAAALIPGVSRSGATISGGLFMGYDRPSAARYSFLLSLPAIYASGFFEARHIGSEAIAWGPMIGSTVVAFVVAFAVIAWLLRFVSTHTFRGFAVYRVLLAAVVAGLLITGVVAAGGA